METYLTKGFILTIEELLVLLIKRIDELKIERN